MKASSLLRLHKAVREREREKLESAEEDIIFAQGSAISVLFLSYFSLARA